MLHGLGDCTDALHCGCLDAAPAPPADTWIVSTLWVAVPVPGTYATRIVQPVPLPVGPFATEGDASEWAADVVAEHPTATTHGVDVKPLHAPTPSTTEETRR